MKALSDWIFTSGSMNVCILLFRNHNFLIVFMRYAKSWSFPTISQQIIKIWPWRRVFLHISLHPIWKLLLGSKAEPCSFWCRRLKTWVQTIRRFPIILRIISKSSRLGNTKHQYRFLQSTRTLLRENTFIEETIRSPKLEWFGRKGRFRSYLRADDI